jgi:hypothetical protein
METAMTLSFEFLKSCKPGELLRVKIEDAAEFAMLGAKEGHSFQALVVIKDNEPPFAINLLESGYMDGDFDTYAALRYGTCEIIPEHNERCEIGEGSLFTKAGSLILSNESKFLVVQAKGGKSLRYFDLATGMLRGEPGRSKAAAFKAWSLWHGGLVAPTPSVPLIQYKGDQYKGPNIL